jgi:hypothetical protein
MNLKNAAVAIGLFSAVTTVVALGCSPSSPGGGTGGSGGTGHADAGEGGGGKGGGASAGNAGSSGSAGSGGSDGSGGSTGTGGSAGSGGSGGSTGTGGDAGVDWVYCVNTPPVIGDTCTSNGQPKGTPCDTQQTVGVCPAASLLGCCVNAPAFMQVHVECFYPPLTTGEAMEQCKTGTWSSSFPTN